MRGGAVWAAAVLVAALAETASAGGPAYDGSGGGTTQRCTSPAPLCTATFEADAASGRLALAVREVGVTPAAVVTDAYVDERLRVEPGDRVTARVRVETVSDRGLGSGLAVSLTAFDTSLGTSRSLEGASGTLLLRTTASERSARESLVRVRLSAEYQSDVRGVCGPQPSPCAGTAVTAVDLAARVVVEDISVERAGG